MSGWIKLYRDIQDHWIWKSDHRLKWWLDILLTVNHADSKVLIGGKLIECKRGQSVMSIETWAKRWGVTKKAVKDFLILLQNDSMLLLENIKITTRITVCNYDNYQSEVNGQETDRKRKRNGQETDSAPKQECKEGIKNDKNILLSDLSESDDHYTKIAYSFWVLFKAKLQEYEIESTDLSRAKAKNWVNPVRLMYVIDKRNDSELREIFQFLKAEKPKSTGFAWSKNIRSTETLRKQFEKLLTEARMLQNSINNGKSTNHKGGTDEQFLKVIGSHLSVK